MNSLVQHYFSGVVNDLRSTVSTREFSSLSLIGLYIVHDEELFAAKTVYHYGQPVACVVADTEHAARMASCLVHVEYEDLPNPVFTIEDAIKSNSFYPTVNTVRDGDIEQGFKESDKVIEGHVNIGGQEQFYFETQNTVAVPEDTDMIIYSSTQNANKTQKFVADALKIPINRVRRCIFLQHKIRKME